MTISLICVLCVNFSFVKTKIKRLLSGFLRKKKLRRSKHKNIPRREYKMKICDKVKKVHQKCNKYNWLAVIRLWQISVLMNE